MPAVGINPSACNVAPADRRHTTEPGIVITCPEPSVSRSVPTILPDPLTVNCPVVDGCEKIALATPNVVKLRMLFACWLFDQTVPINPWTKDTETLCAVATCGDKNTKNIRRDAKIIRLMLRTLAGATLPLDIRRVSGLGRFGSITCEHSSLLYITGLDSHLAA